MKTSLDYRKNFLCVVAESCIDGSFAREWYPVCEADETAALALVGRPVVATDSGEGIYADREGNVFQLANAGKTKPLEVERVAAEPNGDLTGLLQASLQKVEQSRPTRVLRRSAGENHNEKPSKIKKRKSALTLSEAPKKGPAPFNPGVKGASSSDVQAPDNCASLNLRQKLALVRRRLGYVQKRGHNDLHNYNYVTAADLAGAVGDILAELGVLVIPRLESISHEPARSGRADAEHLTHVVMNYSFVDVDTAEEIMVKVAGEGADVGDKAPYKAMTGALKYALLQSFLLATGDDPEDERLNPVDRSGASRECSSDQMITEKDLHELRRLIEETDTELERVLTYYKLSSLEEMTEGTFRRAFELLKRKKAKQNGGESAHAQN
jgi:hypothetical protein